MISPILSITESDKLNPLWSKLQTMWGERLEVLRKQNDSIGRDELDTAILRGRIAELKVMMFLDKDIPIVEEVSAKRGTNF